MSSNSLASAANAPPPPSAAGSGSPKPEDQAKILEDGLGVVKIQAYHMKRALETGNVMDGLKHASTMLSELRTNHLTPKTYYELYMAIFDELRFLTTYLYGESVCLTAWWGGRRREGGGGRLETQIHLSFKYSQPYTHTHSHPLYLSPTLQTLTCPRNTIYLIFMN